MYYLAALVYGSIVCFDLSTHQRRDMDLPVIDGTVASLSELDGRLFASLVPSGGTAYRDAADTMDVWVLDEDAQHGGKVWVHSYSFELDGTARRDPRPLLLRGGRMLVKRADVSLCYYDMADGGAGGNRDGAAEEVVVYEHKGGSSMSGVTADVFMESLLPLRAILRA